MKAIEIGKTYDPESLTSTGWLFQLRRRRHGQYFVSATYRTRWHGAKTGERWEMNLTPGLTLAEAEAAAQDVFEDFADILFVQGFSLFDAATIVDVVRQAPYGVWYLVARGHIVK